MSTYDDDYEDDFHTTNKNMFFAQSAAPEENIPAPQKQSLQGNVNI